MTDLTCPVSSPPFYAILRAGRWMHFPSRKEEAQMKQIIANLSAALTFVLITLLYYGSAAGLSNRLFSSIMSTDMWLTAAFLLIYLIVVLPLSIVAASKVKALLSHRL